MITCRLCLTDDGPQFITVSRAKLANNLLYVALNVHKFVTKFKRKVYIGYRYFEDTWISITKCSICRRNAHIKTSSIRPSVSTELRLITVTDRQTPDGSLKPRQRTVSRVMLTKFHTQMRFFSTQLNCRVDLNQVLHVDYTNGHSDITLPHTMRNRVDMQRSGVRPSVRPTDRHHASGGDPGGSGGSKDPALSWVGGHV